MMLLSTSRNRIFCGVLMICFGFSYTAAAQDKENSFLKKQQTLAERWELEPKYNKGNFIITPYKPVFVTAGRWSDRPNEHPVSENPDYTLPLTVPYNNYEAKFQFSLKTKVIHAAFHGHMDVWIAYTQKAHWQIYNAALSRPFRELNYEPEIILNFPVKFSLFGLTGRMVGVAFNHQSNGRMLPLSRSWNRIIVHAGFERNSWQLLLKGWYRLPDEEDENPAISDFAGRAEATVVRNIKKHQLSVIASSALKPGYPGRGNLQFSWVFPVFDNLRGSLQVADGYGETLIDYNHHQTTIGLALALTDW